MPEGPKEIGQELRGKEEESRRVRSGFQSHIQWDIQSRIVGLRRFVIQEAGSSLTYFIGRAIRTIG